MIYLKTEKRMWLAGHHLLISNKVWSKIETDENCIKENINEDLRGNIQKSCFLFMREGGLGMKGRLLQKNGLFLKFWKTKSAKIL